VLKTSAEIAAIKGVSSQAANKFILKSGIEPSGRKGKYKTYDCTAEPLAGYLKGTVKIKTPLPEIPPAGPSETGAVATYTPKPLGDLVADLMPGGLPSASYFFSDAIKIAQDNKDAKLLYELGREAAKEAAKEILYRQTLETERAKEAIARGRADRIQLENQIRRNEYMEKAAVKLIFGKQYAIDTSVLQPLGLKLKDTISAVCLDFIKTVLKAPDANRAAIIQELVPKIEGDIQRLIDDEIFSALESKKRLLAEYISGAETS